ncbi:MAG: dynamin family protein [Pseudomonadota bacterium]
MNVEKRIAPVHGREPGEDLSETEFPDGPTAAEQETGSPRAARLGYGIGAFSAFLTCIDDLDVGLETIAEIGDRTAQKSARRLQHQLRTVEPSVTMIGQVKAGKTSLVNAMLGWPQLLPADVNPWTSVVTSLHVSPRAHPGGNHASFRFFEEEEWSRLIERGGRIGELAGRAGADDELEKVTRQLEEMRLKSKRRLGDKFELLLGQAHNYGYFDTDLIERYVCLGDDFEDDTETAANQGRFADVTKSADLFLQRDGFPMDLCIRDTPGVNDTFMMREQITIRAIRESRICVVVLSAHQALSTVDLALIRLISNIPSREVIIFVNRIDELSDPSRQVPEIRESIRRTLKTHHGPTDAEILFGSAHWATNALSGSLEDLDEASSAALINWAETQMADAPVPASVEDMIWELSGVPSIYRTLAARIEQGIGAEVTDRVARSASNLLSGIEAARQIVSVRSSDSRVLPLDRKSIGAEVDRVEAAAMDRLRSEFEGVMDEFAKRLDRSHKGFLDRATASLVEHLEKFGENEVWHYDPTGLRVLMRSSYRVFAKSAETAMQKVFLEATSEMREIYLRAFNVPDASFGLAAPQVPRIPSPVLLGQTIALDMKGSWWSRWWHRRRGYRAFAMDFAEMIQAETDPIVQSLRSEHAKSVEIDAVRVLQEFAAAQRATLAGLAAQAETTMDDVVAAGQSASNRGRAEALEKLSATLGKYVEPAAPAATARAG